MATGRMPARPTALDARGRAMEIAAQLGASGPSPSGACSVAPGFRPMP